MTNSPIATRLWLGTVAITASLITYVQLGLGLAIGYSPYQGNQEHKKEFA